MATTSTAFRQLSDGNSVGTVLGISSTDLIGFYGVTAAAAKSGTNFGTLSTSSGALASSIAIVLNNLGLITCTSVAA
jgi:hypothetical protein